jgi:hypothetical protein
VVSPALPVRCPEGRSRVRPPAMPKILHKTNNQSRGATWQPMTGPRGTLTNQPNMPRVNADWPTCLPRQLPYCHVTVLPVIPAVLPCQPATSAADVTRATCHPYSGDTCHLWIGPTVPVRPNLPATCHSPGAAMCHLPLDLPCVTCTDRTVCTVSMTRGLYGLYSHPIFFACLTFRTERDIFSIRSPFDKVNIPPESGRRDGRNGIGFVAFRALSFLSIFQALSGFWIRFRITYSEPTNIEKQVHINMVHKEIRFRGKQLPSCL